MTNRGMIKRTFQNKGPAYAGELDSDLLPSGDKESRWGIIIFGPNYDGTGRKRGGTNIHCSTEKVFRTWN